MLRITIQATELFNELTDTFVEVPALVLDLEHSLVSLSKWESIYEKPFLAPNQKSSLELLDYVRLMIITPNVPENIILRFSKENISEVQEYINSKQTATTFGEMPQHKGRGETITSELIYYWMVSFQIPFGECETWHLNRLFSLIRICNVKNAPKKQRVPKGQAAAQRRAENARRRAELGSRG